MTSKEIEMMTMLDSMSVNLPVDICIDTEGFNKPLCVYFRNGYNRHVDEWLPILVCENPKRIGDDKLKITQVDYYDVEEFVAKYAETLVDITLDKKDFYNDILLVCDRNNLNESLSSYKRNDKGFAVKPETAVEWVYAYPAKFGVDIYKRNISPYRYMYSKDGIESLYKDEQGKPIYFPNAQPYDDTGKTYVTSNGEWFLIKSNGDYNKV